MNLEIVEGHKYNKSDWSSAASKGSSQVSHEERPDAQHTYLFHNIDAICLSTERKKTLCKLTGTWTHLICTHSIDQCTQFNYVRGGALYKENGESPLDSRPGSLNFLCVQQEVTLLEVAYAPVSSERSEQTMDGDSSVLTGACILSSSSWDSPATVGWYGAPGWRKSAHERHGDTVAWASTQAERLACRLPNDCDEYMKLELQLPVIFPSPFALPWGWPWANHSHPQNLIICSSVWSCHSEDQPFRVEVIKASWKLKNQGSFCTKKAGQLVDLQRRLNIAELQLLRMLSILYSEYKYFCSAVSFSIFAGMHEQAVSRVRYTQCFMRHSSHSCSLTSWTLILAFADDSMNSLHTTEDESQITIIRTREA